MDIDAYKEKIISLTKEFGDLPGRTPHNKTTAFFHLTEEVGEVGELLRHEVQNPHKFSKEKLSEELADVILWSVFLANTYDIDVSEALQENLDKIRRKIDKEKSR